MRSDLAGTYREWKSWAAEAFGNLSANDAAYFDAELRKAGVTDVGGLNVFEVGFGNGAFATWTLRQQGRYFGVEAIEELVARATSAGLDVRHASTQLNDWIVPASLDIAVAFDVFEHIPVKELQRLLVSIFQCLKPGALLIGRVPSGDSPFARAIQHGDLTHCTVIGSSAARQLAQQTGFDVVSLSAPAMPLKGVGFIRAVRRLAVVSVSRLAHAFIRNMLMGGGNPVLTPNMLMVWRRPEVKRSGQVSNSS